ncbi:hypothetical protein DV515_00016243, partial [Chloebia gouldiae]
MKKVKTKKVQPLASPVGRRWSEKSFKKQLWAPPGGFRLLTRAVVPFSDTARGFFLHCKAPELDDLSPTPDFSIPFLCPALDSLGLAPSEKSPLTWCPKPMLHFLRVRGIGGINPTVFALPKSPNLFRSINSDSSCRVARLRCRCTPHTACTPFYSKASKGNPHIYKLE